MHGIGSRAHKVISMSKPTPQKLAAIQRARADKEIARLRKALKGCRDFITADQGNAPALWVTQKMIDKALAGVE